MVQPILSRFSNLDIGWDGLLLRMVLLLSLVYLLLNDNNNNNKEHDILIYTVKYSVGGLIKSESGSFFFLLNAWFLFFSKPSTSIVLNPSNVTVPKSSISSDK